MAMGLCRPSCPGPRPAFLLLSEGAGWRRSPGRAETLLRVPRQEEESLPPWRGQAK